MKYGVNNITYQFIYFEIVLLSKKLNNESRKLKETIFVSKTIIISLKKDNKKLLDKIDRLKNKQSLLIHNSSSALLFLISLINLSSANHKHEIIIITYNQII